MRAHGEVRGTQSFVGVMAAVFRRPSLTAIEVAWRWSFAGLLWLALALFGLGAGLEAEFHPVELITTLTGSPLLTQMLRSFAGNVEGLRKAAGLFPPVLVLWCLLRTVGRRLLLRRLGVLGQSFDSTRASLALGLFRVGALYGIWYGALVATANFATRLVLDPPWKGGEANFLLFFVILICAGLFIFFAWMLGSFVFDLAAVTNARTGAGVFASLRAALRPGKLGMKLVEVNLVMGIVKIALLVLALVFSASPLPFTAVATPAFLAWWWAAVGIWYCVASDYFHVVRLAAYHALWRAYDQAEVVQTPAAASAS